MIKAFIPEIFLSFCILQYLLVNCFLQYNSKLKFPLIEKEIFFQFLFILIITLFLTCSLKIYTFNYFLLYSNISIQFIKIFFLIICLFTLIFIWRGFNLQRLNFSEYFIIYFASLLASLLILNSSNFLILYLLLEMQSICFYILTLFYRTSIIAVTAGLKYFISSSIISIVFLIGGLFLYIRFGTLDFNDLSTFLFLTNNSIYSDGWLYFGICCIFITLFFKLTVAPFHWWFPQIYDGAPLASLIIFLIIPKIIFFSLFLKFWPFLSGCFNSFKIFFNLIGLYSLFYGIIMALKQARLKKLLIYSSISQMGFIVCSISGNSLENFGIAYFFLIIYTLSSILILGFLVWFNVFESLQSNKILNVYRIFPLYKTTFFGFSKFNFPIAFFFIIIFFSLGGIPPLLGFFIKLSVYFTIVKSIEISFVLILAFLGAISVYYYINIIKIMFFENKNHFYFYKRFNIYNISLISLDCHIFSCIIYIFFFFSIYSLDFLKFSFLIVNNFYL